MIYGYLPFLFSKETFDVYPIVQDIDKDGLGKISAVTKDYAYNYIYKGAIHSYKEEDYNTTTGMGKILNASTINSFCTMPNDLTAKDDETCNWAK